MNNLGHATRVNMTKQVLNNFVLISDQVRNNLFLLAVHEQLYDFAEVSCKDRVDQLIIFSLNELEKAVKQHVLANLLIIRFL